MKCLAAFSAQRDLLPLTQSLWAQNIPHRVRFSTSEQQLWLQDDGQEDEALALLAAFDLTSPDRSV